MVDFLNFQKTYGTHKVLSIPELNFSQGIYWITGVNGSGKSTLLRSMAGIIPFEGEIFINGHGLKRNPIKSRRQVGYCEAEPTYPVFLTAFDIIRFIAYVRKLAKTEVRNIVGYFGIDQFQDQPTGGFSEGMLKKLALCIAFLGKLPWILLDEPFAFIDLEMEEKLCSLIDRHIRQDINFIITSHHDPGKLSIMPDHKYVIRDTQLIKV